MDNQIFGGFTNINLDGKALWKSGSKISFLFALIEGKFVKFKCKQPSYEIYSGS